jgi:CIC family chloride channel protein
VSMGAILGGTMRSPLTGIVFAIELTHDLNVALPLLVACTVAHAFTVLVMRRSILTEKISRRGYHLSREYAVDPLEILFVREVMRTSVAVLPAAARVDELAPVHDRGQRGQHLYPVIENGRLVGVVSRGALAEMQADPASRSRPLGELVGPRVVTAHPDEPLRAIVYRMAETGHTRLPVVSRAPAGTLLGIVSLEDLLKARARNLEAERRLERVHPMHLFFPARASREEEEARAS